MTQHVKDTTFNPSYGARDSVPRAVVLFVAGENDVFDNPQLPLMAALLSQAGIELIIVEMKGAGAKGDLGNVPDSITNFMSTLSPDMLPEIYGTLEQRIAKVAGFYALHSDEPCCL